MEKLGTGIIKRASIDDALSNLSKGLRRDEQKVEHNINVAWGSYTEALATAGKNKGALDNTAAKNLKRKMDSIEADHQKEAAAGRGSFEASEQKRERARKEYKQELEHNQELFDRDAKEAANHFRHQSGEFIETYTTANGATIENFRATHP